MTVLGNLLNDISETPLWIKRDFIRDTIAVFDGCGIRASKQHFEQFAFVCGKFKLKDHQLEHFTLCFRKANPLFNPFRFAEAVAKHREG